MALELLLLLVEGATNDEEDVDVAAELLLPPVEDGNVDVDVCVVLATVLTT